MANPNWCTGFAVSKSTHKEVKKSAEKLEADRKRVKQRREVEEREAHKAQLKDWGIL